MTKVVIYSSAWCGFCSRAKALLKSKGVQFEEISVDMNAAARAEMTEKAGGRTSVPQIWINDRHIGGSDDLATLNKSGELDTMLAHQ